MRRTVAALTLALWGGGVTWGQLPPSETLSSRLKGDVTIQDRLRPMRGGLEERKSRQQVAPLPPVSRFAEPAAGAAAEQLITFDPNQIDLKRLGTHWQLVAGATVIKDFGTDEETARKALPIIRDLNLTQRGTIGRPRPVMEYWLSSGQAPQAGTTLRRLINFDLPTLRVELFQNQWCVRDDLQVLMAFGPFAADAQRALEVICQYRFGQLGVIGRLPEGIMFFVGVPAEVLGAREPQTTPSTIDKSKSPTGKINPNQLALAGDLRPDIGIPGERTRIDCRKMELVHTPGHWKLVDAGYCVADYGLAEMQAHEALRLLQKYRFTDQYRLGNGDRPLTYYLTNDQPPRGVPFGPKRVPFQLASLEVRRVGDNWALCDRQQLIWNFGSEKAEAEKALKAVQMYKFDHLCQVGDSGPAPLVFLVRER